MKKLALALLLLSVALVPAPASSETSRAVIIKDTACGLFDGDGGFVYTEDTMILGAHSANGNSKLTCKAKDVPNSTGRAVVFNFENTGALCGIFSPHGFLTTDDWQETVSASGVATLQCHYKLPE